MELNSDQMDFIYGIKLWIIGFGNNEVIIDLEESNFGGVVEAESERMSLRKSRKKNCMQ